MVAGLDKLRGRLAAKKIHLFSARSAERTYLRQKVLHFNLLCFWLTMALSLAHFVTVTLAHLDSLWLSLALSGSLSGAHQLKKVLAWLAKF